MKKVFFFLPLVSLMLVGCAVKTQPVNSNQLGNNNQAGLANPASVFCQDNGGTLDIRTSSDGSQSGVCVFNDGSECDEWSYYRGECQPKSQTENISEKIKVLFIQKYSKSPDEVLVRVTQQTSDHARGDVKFGKDGIGEGGIFLAAKVEGKWQLVFDGNGIVKCSQLSGYNFPPTMIPDCLNY